MNTQKPSKEKRDIRLVFLVFFGIFGFLAYRHQQTVLGYALILMDIMLLFLLVYSPMTLRPAFMLWLKTAKMMQQMNTRILLFFIFICIFVPVGLIMRMFGRDPLQIKSKTETAWKPYEFVGLKDKSRYERQY